MISVTYEKDSGNIWNERMFS